MDDFMSQLRVVQFSKQVFQIPPPQFSSVVKNLWKHVGDMRSNFFPQKIQKEKLGTLKTNVYHIYMGYMVI